MKKILGISLVAVLAVSPMMAMAAAADVDKQPTHTESAATNVATANPQYALAQSNANDGNFATAGYVKGAYNASIRAINNVAGQVSNLGNTYAKKDLTNVTAGSVTETLINDGAVTTSKLGADAVTNANLADDAVHTENILDANVTAAKLATDAVETAKIKDLNVTTGKLADEAVTTAKIDDEAVTAAKIATGTITTTQVAGTSMATGSSANAENTKLTTQGYVDDAISGLNIGDYATKTGVEDTIEGATYSTTLDSGSVVTGTVAVPTTAAYNVMATWGDDTATPGSITLTGSTDVALANGTVSSASFNTTATAATYPANP